MEYPGSRGVIVASTYKNLNDFIVPMLTQQLWEEMGQPDAWDDLVVSFNKTTNIIQFNNGSYIYLRSCDRPDDLKGPNLSWFYIDEASKVPLRVWKIMVARLRVAPEEGWITTTPRGRNWIWEEFARRNRRNYEYFTGATSENKKLSKDYIESLKESYSGSYLAQEFYGEFVGWEGLVYNVNVDKHHLDIVEPRSDAYKYAISGVDWGWVNPSCLLVGLVGFDDNVHIVQEYYEKKKPIETLVDIALEMNERWGIRTYFCDSARPEYIQDFRNDGLDARKGKKELDPGIASVNKHFAIEDSERNPIEPILKIDFNECPNLIDELDSYHYEEDDLGTVLKDRPVKKDDHACDALRYLIYSHSKRGYCGSRKGNR